MLWGNMKNKTNPDLKCLLSNWADNLPMNEKQISRNIWG